MGSTVSLTETNQLIYATATAITGKLGKKQPKPHTQNMKEPIWREKIHKEIKRLWQDLPILNEIDKGSQIKDWKKKQLERRLNIRKKDDLPVAKEILKQKIQAKAQRLKRFEKRSAFFR